MKNSIQKTILFFVFLLWVNVVFAQKYNPAIVVLLPDSTYHIPEIHLLVDSINKGFNNNKDRISRWNDDENTKEKSENQALIVAKFLEIKDLDVFRLVTIATSGYLLRNFSEGLSPEKILIYPIQQKTIKNLDSLQMIASIHQVRYVIGFSKVRILQEKDRMYYSIQAFLFDNESNKIILDKVYEKNNNNYLVFKENQPKLWDYAFTSEIALLGQDIYSLIVKETDNFQDNNQKENARLKYFKEKMILQHPNNEIIEIINQNKDTTGVNSIFFKSNVESWYSGFFNADKTKFFAMFLTRRYEYKLENGITTTEKIDTNTIKEYARLIDVNMVAGIFYEGKWYLDKITSDIILPIYVNGYEKQNLEDAFFYRLIRWGFFKPHNAELNPEFWETTAFQKIQTDFSEDIANTEKSIIKEKDPKWQKFHQGFIESYKKLAKRNAEFKKPF